MNAMTWWDWESQSVWGQPWGAAIDGELTGTRLNLLPYELVPWQTWLEHHPDAKVLVDERAGRPAGNADIRTGRFPRCTRCWRVGRCARSTRPGDGVNVEH